MGDITATMIKPTTTAMMTMSIGSKTVIIRLVACSASYSMASAM